MCFQFCKGQKIYAIKTINIEKKRNFELVVRQSFRNWEPIMAKYIHRALACDLLDITT
jgi:hypothetical protein